MIQIVVHVLPPRFFFVSVVKLSPKLLLVRKRNWIRLARHDSNKGKEVKYGVVNLNVSVERQLDCKQLIVCN